MDPFEVAVVKDDRLVTQPPASRTLNLGAPPAVEQLVLGDLEQPARRRTTVTIKPLEVRDDSRECFSSQIKGELPRAGATQVIASHQRQPSPVKLRERPIIAARRRPQQIAVLGTC